ncbi:MAG: TetR/AcrR family transcriptional regulator [Devosiaceae bacterium]|nr:TetR/AcrR family transcriptional regulator [Devosiaceae bacterium]
MQEKSTNRRSNTQRSNDTRAALLKAARQLFVANGYAQTGTPKIVSAAKVTRGALYHHFKDKKDLFESVVTHEAQQVAAQIDLNSLNSLTRFDNLMAGCNAYFDAMAVPGRTRLLLIDGPSILGHDQMELINSQTAGEKLHQGLILAIEDKQFSPQLLTPLTELLSACFDKAALAIAQGDSAENYKDAIRLLLERFR